MYAEKFNGEINSQIRHQHSHRTTTPIGFSPSGEVQEVKVKKTSTCHLVSGGIRHIAVGVANEPQGLIDAESADFFPFSRERLRRVLRKKAAVILHLHTFTPADLDLPHLHTCRSRSSHPHICRSRSSHPHICRSRSSHPHIC